MPAFFMFICCCFFIQSKHRCDRLVQQKKQQHLTIFLHEFLDLLQDLCFVVIINISKMATSGSMTYWWRKTTRFKKKKKNPLLTKLFFPSLYRSFSHTHTLSLSHPFSLFPLFNSELTKLQFQTSFQYTHFNI